MLAELAKLAEKDESELFAVSSSAIAIAYSMASCRNVLSIRHVYLLNAFGGIRGNVSDVYLFLFQLTSNLTLVVSSW